MYFIAEKIFRLKVPVDDVLLVHVFQAKSNLLDDLSSLLLWQFPFLLDLLQTAIRKQFHHQVQIFLVIKVAKQGSEMRM